MNNCLLLLSLIVYISANSFSQTSVLFNKNLKSKTIRNELISFDNEQQRIFVLINQVSCHECVIKTSAMIDKIQDIKKDSCEVFIIVKGDSSNVLSNRLKISHFNEIFKNTKNILFDFDNSYNSVLDIELYKYIQFPIIINIPKQSERIWINNYRKQNLNKILSQ